MKQIIILNREDLYNDNIETPLEEINLASFRILSKHIYEAGMIVFQDDNEDVKILKNRYGRETTILHNQVRITISDSPYFGDDDMFF